MLHGRLDVVKCQVCVEGEGGRVRAKGVVLVSGELIEADAVVCNADLPYAEKALLPASVARSFEVSQAPAAYLVQRMVA